MDARSWAIFGIVTAAIVYYFYTPLPQHIDDQNPYRIAMTCIKAVQTLVTIANIYDPFFGINLTRNFFSYSLRVPHENYRKAIDKIEVSDSDFDGVPVRIYTPTDSNAPNPTMIYAHGGLWMFFNRDDMDFLMYSLANRTRSVVVSIEYRLAPEHKYPAAFNDIYEASRYLLTNYERLNVDKSRIAIAGDSIGANMATAIVQKLRKENREIKMQILIEPTLQFFDLTLPSFQQNLPYHHLTVLDYQGISRVIFEYFDVYIKPRLLANNNHTSPDMKKSIISEKYVSWDLLPKKYLNSYNKINDRYGEDRSIVEKRRVLFTPDVSPLLANDYTLQHMPQTYVVTAEYDPFRDDGLIYAERLRQMGVNIELKHYEHGYHGALYFLANDYFKLPKRMFEDLVLYINKNL